jgi:hypothetical protein
MSETHVETPVETPESQETEVEQPQVETPEGEEDDGGEDSEEGERRVAKVDWEKQAHDKAGLAAKERSRRRSVERQNAELMGRLEALEQRGKASGDDVAELVAALRDDDDEPITDLNQIKRVLKTFIARQAEEEKAEGERQTYIKQTRTISDGMSAFEADFADEHADYFQAASFYRQTRATELEDLGYVGARLNQKLAEELYGLTAEVMRAGRDPAEVVYGLAKRRGFASGKDAANAKLKKLQTAGASAGTPNGKGTDNGLSWAAVAKLKGAARDAAFSKLRARELGKA